jgi:hypothetical protein
MEDAMTYIEAMYKEELVPSGHELGCCLTVTTAMEYCSAKVQGEIIRHIQSVPKICLSLFYDI